MHIYKRFKGEEKEMKIINRKNILTNICVTYTVVSLTLTMYEIITTGSMNPTQLNIFLFFLLSILGVVILSQHYRFERFSPLTMMLIQYVSAIVLIVVSMKIASFFVLLHPDGYHDMIVSFSIPYVIGAILYYCYLYAEIRKQNRILQEIKQQAKEK